VHSGHCVASIQQWSMPTSRSDWHLATKLAGFSSAAGVHSGSVVPLSPSSRVLVFPRRMNKVREFALHIRLRYKTLFRDVTLSWRRLAHSCRAPQTPFRGLALLLAFSLAAADRYGEATMIPLRILDQHAGAQSPTGLFFAPSLLKGLPTRK
jgi:hypothetical protein